MANATLTRFFKCSMRDRRPGARAGRLPGAGWALRHATCGCALAARDKAQVDAVYHRAIELGGSCEGKPGDRLDGALYAAYFRDPDGHKFGIFVPAR